MLKRNGFQTGDRVAIYAKNSPYWLLTDLAVQFLQGITAPIYDTMGLTNVKYCLNKVSAKFMFVSLDYLPSALTCLDSVESLKCVVSYDSFDVEKILSDTHKLLQQMAEFSHSIDETHSLYSSQKDDSNSHLDAE